MAQIEWLDVSDITPRIAYTVGVTPQSVFDVPFIFFADADLVVSVNGVTMVLDTHYTVTGAGSESGGQVTFVSPKSNCKVSIVREVSIALDTHIPTFGPLDVGAINLQFSRFIAIQQDLNARSIQLPRNDGASGNVLASVWQRKNRLLGFGTDGELIYASGPSFVSDTMIGVANVDSRAVAQVTSFPDTVEIVRTGGYASPGDGADATYKSVDSEPLHGGKFQSGDGGWWALNEVESTSSTTYRNNRTWRPERFGELGKGLASDDAIFASFLPYISGGDVLDLGNHTYLLDNDLIFPSVEQLEIVGNPTFVFTSRAGNESGKLKFVNCPGLLMQGRFKLTGAEDSTSWEALANEAARAEVRPLIFVKDSQDVRLEGIFQTSNTSTVVTARACTNFLVDGIRHAGWAPDLSPITDGNIPSPAAGSAPTNPNYLMTVRLLGSFGATARNIRVSNHGSAVVNGSSARYVSATDVIARHMYDNGVYNSSGDEFVATNVRVDYCTGSAAKSRGAISTIAHVKAFSCVVGATVSPIPNESSKRAQIFDVSATLGHHAVLVDRVVDATTTYIQDVTVRGCSASDMRGAGATAPFNVTTTGRATIVDCSVDGFASNKAIQLIGGATGEGNGGKFSSVQNCTVKNGKAAIELNYVDQYKLIGNSFQSLTDTNIVVVLEGFSGEIRGNTSSTLTKRISLDGSFGDGCKYNRCVGNDMSVFGPSTLNEYWGNYNKQLVPITGNVPFRVGQMGFDSATGRAMIAENNTATTDWKVLS